MLSLFSSKPEIKSVRVDDITEICKGIHTEVMQKAGLVDPCCSLSVVTAQRSLDVQFDTCRERDSVYLALETILQTVRDHSVLSPKAIFRD